VDQRYFSAAGFGLGNRVGDKAFTVGEVGGDQNSFRRDEPMDREVLLRKAIEGFHWETLLLLPTILGFIELRCNVDHNCSGFRAKVQEALDDLRSAVPGDEVKAHFGKRRLTAGWLL